MKMTSFAQSLRLTFFLLLVISGLNTLGAQEFRSSWFTEENRVWLGPEYWANRLQDWEIRNQRLECRQGVANKPMRTVHLLTHRLSPDKGEITMTVTTGLIDSSNKYEGTAYNASTGFLIGAGGKEMDYRAAALIHHNPGPGGGYFAGIDGSGEVFIRDFESPLTFEEKSLPGSSFPADRKTPIFKGILDEVLLILKIIPKGDKYEFVLTARNIKTEELIGRVTETVSEERVVGNLALVSHPGGIQKTDRYWFRDWNQEQRDFNKWASATARFWFKEWNISGSKLEVKKERAIGPVLSTQYTVDGNTLNLTAQLFPTGNFKNQNVELQVRTGNEWKFLARTKVIVPGYTAKFRVKRWDSTRDITYRVVYHRDNRGKPKDKQCWYGTIRKDPADKNPVVLAAFTGNMMVRGGYEYPLPYGVDVPFDPELEGKPVTQSNIYLWNSRVYFPHVEVVNHVRKHEPDLLFFSGDQVYEGNPTRAVEKPGEEAHLDYLYKWYLWCWTWRDLTKEIPTITIPDDHDVYQRNIWGNGGEFSPEGDLDGSFGGYFMDPDWINMIQRTQTSHLPESFEREPVKNGIEVYFTSLTVGGVGFAILEDRKFKSFPTVVKTGKSRDSHITQTEYDTREADVPGAKLLGDRQLKFLNEFSKDWVGQEMKAVLSQTLFANLQILSQRADNVPQEFSIPLDRDLDSNGWPQTGRKKALHEMRRGFMVHIAGDQHLGSVIHHGTDEWEDSGWSFCVPSVANYYARSWNPQYPSLDYKPGMAPFTGRYEDGFFNKLTVKAVANPVVDAQPGDFPEPLELHKESPGYGIILFDKSQRKTTFECWPRFVDPTDPESGSMYNGWPVTVNQEDNYSRSIRAWLPTLKITGREDPVVQVIDESNKEIVYTLKINGSLYQPKVFKQGYYTIIVEDPETDRKQTFRHVNAEMDNDKILKVHFRRKRR